MAIHPLQGIELFSGVGMLGEGLRAGFAHMGIPYRAICHVEREAYAASVMVARMEEGSMDAAPIWPDVRTFDAAAWRGKVDCIVAGFPCQDLSVAGKRAGLDGKRSGLFFEVTRIADDSGAWLILLENVAGIASATATVMDEAEGELEERAAARVLGELADLGWNAEWITLSASDVGASHGRARWFCLCWRTVADGKSIGTSIGSDGQRGDGAGSGQTGSATERVGSCAILDDAMRSERGAGCICGSGGKQGDDGERETDGRIGISGETHLGNPESQRKIRTADEQRRASSFRRASEPLDNSISIGRRARRMPDGEHERDFADAASPIFMADPGNPRPQGNKQQSAHEPDGRTDGRTDGARTMPINCRIS